MSEEKRKRIFQYNSENPIKIDNRGALFNSFYIDELMFCGGDNATYNDIWILELSNNSTNSDCVFKNYEKGITFYN